MTNLYGDSRVVRLATGRDVRALVRWRDELAETPTCLLLHGNPGSLLDFAEVLEPLAALANVVAFDLPGFGQSARTGLGPTELDLDHLARDALSLVEALSLRGPLFLVGHSHGGGVAQVAASAHPERVAGIVLVSTLTARPHQSYRLLALPGARHFANAVGLAMQTKLLGWLNRRLLRSIMADFFHPEAVPAARVDAELELFSARREVLLSMVDVARGDPCRRLALALKELRCPAAIVHGENDALVPAEYAADLHAAILAAGGRSDFVAVPNAGHLLLRYQPESVVSAVRELLARPRAAS